MSSMLASPEDDPLLPRPGLSFGTSRTAGVPPQGGALDTRAPGDLTGRPTNPRDLAQHRTLGLRQDLRHALDSGDQLYLVYQPRTHAVSGRCVAVEALARWSHPERGSIAPSEFMPLVEQSPLAERLTAWVLNGAVSQLARWRAAGFDLDISINLSAENLQDADLAAHVAQVLATHRIHPRHVELEITETAIMTDVGLARRRLDRLAASGLRIAVDDFGTGHSSLSHLQDLPVHLLKMDPLFSTRLDTDGRQLSIVRMITSLARDLGCRCVAQGVETATAVAQLRAAGCDELQGFYFASPMAPDMLRPWLQANDQDCPFKPSSD